MGGLDLSNTRVYPELGHVAYVLPHAQTHREESQEIPEVGAKSGKDKNVTDKGTAG